MSPRWLLPRVEPQTQRRTALDRTNDRVHHHSRTRSERDGPIAPIFSVRPFARGPSPNAYIAVPGSESAKGSNDDEFRAQPAIASRGGMAWHGRHLHHDRASLRRDDLPYSGCLRVREHAARHHANSARSQRGPQEGDACRFRDIQRVSRFRSVPGCRSRSSDDLYPGRQIQGPEIGYRIGRQPRCASISTRSSHSNLGRCAIDLRRDTKGFPGVPRASSRRGRRGQQL